MNPYLADTAVDTSDNPWAGARCAEVDPELFFPEKGIPAKPAKRICSGCDLRAQCLAYALEHQMLGIWGGTSGKERREMLNARRAA